MLKTRADLAEAVLRELGVIDAVETPASEDRDYVIAAYDLKYQELAAPGLELAYWAPDEIPAAVFLTLKDMVANEVRSAFGEVFPPEEKNAREMDILKRLRRHIGRAQSGTIIRAEYF